MKTISFPESKEVAWPITGDEDFPPAQSQPKEPSGYDWDEGELFELYSTERYGWKEAGQ